MHYIIIANGEFLVSEMIREAVSSKKIIALDGAANQLAALGIKPHVILGDFDSISVRTRHEAGIKHVFDEITIHDTAYLGNDGIMIIPAKNQAFTDLTKAIHYCDEHHAMSITIICAHGGRLDHHESSLRTLRVEYKKERPILLHTEQQTIRFAKDETISFRGEKGDKCGIIAYPSGSVTTSGLQYASDERPLHFGFSEDTCNVLISQEVTVKVTGEALLIMPPQLASQREFMRKSKVDRLRMLLRDATIFQSHNIQTPPHGDA